MPPDGAGSVLHGEILEQPGAVARLLERERRNAAALAAGWRRAKVPFVLIAARGTSDNAARYAQYAFGLASRLPVALAAPSLVTLYGVPPRLKGALVIGISQSGRSPDIVETIAAARHAGSPTLAIVNDAESPLARAAPATSRGAAAP
jgi:glucosamine--fructose-6-phosphate aminotransferase (isomerizing)